MQTGLPFESSTLTPEKELEDLAPTRSLIEPFSKAAEESNIVLSALPKKEISLEDYLILEDILDEGQKKFIKLPSIGEIERLWDLHQADSDRPFTVEVLDLDPEKQAEIVRDCVENLEEKLEEIMHSSKASYESILREASTERRATQGESYQRKLGKAVADLLGWLDEVVPQELQEDYEYAQYNVLLNVLVAEVVLSNYVESLSGKKYKSSFAFKTDVVNLAVTTVLSYRNSSEKGGEFKPDDLFKSWESFLPNHFDIQKHLEAFVKGVSKEAAGYELATDAAQSEGSFVYLSEREGDLRGKDLVVADEKGERVICNIDVSSAARFPEPIVFSVIRKDDDNGLYVPERGGLRSFDESMIETYTISPVFISDIKKRGVPGIVLRIPEDYQKDDLTNILRGDIRFLKGLRDGTNG